MSVRRNSALAPRPEECCPSVLAAPLSETEAAELSRGFAAIADPVRLRLISLLADAPDGICACDLMEPLGKSQPTISHHLKILTESGLVEGEREGKWIWYRLVDDAVTNLRNALTK